MQGQAIINYSLFYKNTNQDVYFQTPLQSEDDTYYSAIIPSDFINSSQMQYYIVLETESNTISIPEVDPIMNPLFINIVSNQTVQNYSNISLEDNAKIISPQPNEKIYSNDLVIILSYYELDDLDYSSIQIFIDDKDLTQKANIKNSHLILYPSNLGFGVHTIKISMNDRNNVSYQPIEWSFVLFDSSENLFKYNGKISHNSLNNNIDNETTYSNVSNFYFNGRTEWTDFHLKLKKSSLESSLQQPQNRYSLLFKHNIFDFNAGDFYPQFNELVLHGNRVRGFGFDLHTNFFQINLVKGQLNRAIQGSPYNSLKLDYSADNILSVSRDNYEFEDEITALRLGLGNREKINFGLNLVKVKDDIKSVDKYVEGSIINLDVLVQQYNSDQYFELDGTEFLYEDINEDGTLNILAANINESPEFIIYEKEIIIIGTCIDDPDEVGDICEECGSEGCSIKQEVWNIEVPYDDLDTILESSFPDEGINYDEEENYLDDNWTGNKPKDNFVIGTDMKINFDRVKINSSIGISLLNENIWNDVISIDEFDTYADDYEDCYYGRTYNTSFSEDNFIWDECQLYQDGDFVANSLAIAYVEDSGIHLDDMPNPEDFEEFFHYNFDAVPTVPFYNLIQKNANDEDIDFKDILNSPEIAYNFDAKLLYPKHTIQFGIKKVGPSFTSLANPYLQSDTKEKYFSERIRLLRNRVFLFFSLKSIDNGLNQESESGRSSTKKYDVNVSFYPIKNLPQLTLNYSFYTKEGGEKLEFENNDTCSNSESTNYSTDCVVDTRLNTETINSSIYLSHNFMLFESKHNLGLSYYKSKKSDLLDNLMSNNFDYVSPSSNSNNYNFSFKSYINNHWNTDIYLSSSYFDFSKEGSEYYQEQDIYTVRLGFSFKNKNIIEEISTWLDYSEGEGTSSYDQYGIKLSVDLNLYKNLLLNLNLRHYYKDLSYTSTDSSDNSKNSIIRANLSYKF